MYVYNIQICKILQNTDLLFLKLGKDYNMIYIPLYSACYQVYERKIIIDDSNEVIFQYEITSKKFHQRESFH
jgi:hypothetical protein